MNWRSAFCLTVWRRAIILSLLSITSLTWFVPASTTHASTHFQEPTTTADRDRGISQYNQGDFKGAIDSLREAIKSNNNDVSSWHYLAEALAKQGNRDEALKAHEKSAKLADDQVTYLIDRQAIFKDRPVALPKTELLDAAQSADEYLALSDKPSSKKVKEWTSRAWFLRALGSDATGLEVFSGRAVTTRVRILSKPPPSYTETARGNRVNGRVLLTALFGPDGQVHAVRVMQGLPDGLTRAAIDAVRQIKFVSATKDGRAVSQWLEVEYGFNIY
jgi:TonB family protein